MKRAGTEAARADVVRIEPLGAGNEVGRSCVMMSFKGKTVMFDCGVHPALSGEDSLPYLNRGTFDMASVDLVLVTHFHLDHCAALPYLLTKTSFSGKAFMTHATFALYKLVLHDFVRMTRGSGGGASSSDPSQSQQLYDEKDFMRSLDRVVPVDYHQEREYNGIKVTALKAGHVLGAAMFMVEVAGVRVLYTGDFSRQEDRHLPGAETPPVPVDIVIVESTYGVQVHESREDRERRFTGWVRDVVKRGGKCLIPVFSLGRAQELLLILDEYWSLHPELQRVPVRYASGLAEKSMKLYQAYASAMNDRMRNQLHPFVFKHVKYLADDDDSDVSSSESGPAVVMASPGMLQSGTSRRLFERWCGDGRNGTVIPGYAVEKSFAKMLMTGQPRSITTMNGREVPMNMSVNYVSFSAHSDFAQTSEFIDCVRPSQVILVHGEATEMGRLKEALTNRYKGPAGVSTVTVSMPKNCQAVQVGIRDTSGKTAKVMGTLADAGAPPPDGRRRISGVLVRKDFVYRVMAPEELPAFTQLKVSRVIQRQRVPFHSPLEVLGHALSQVYARTESTAEPERVSVSGGIVTITRAPKSPVEPASAVVEWEAGSSGDVVADAALCMMLTLESNPLLAAKYEQRLAVARKDPLVVLREQLSKAELVLKKHFGNAEIVVPIKKEEDPSAMDVAAAESPTGRIRLRVDDAEALIEVPSFKIKTESLQLLERLSIVVSLMKESLLPVEES